MPKSSKPRKKYNPAGRKVLANPLAFVIEGFQPLDTLADYMTRLHLRNHSAMEALTKGRANYEDMNTLLGMNNICVALLSMGVGVEYDHLATEGFEALKAVTDRCMPVERFVCKAQEITALNAYMELHDAQMSAITINTLEEAIKVAKAKKLPRLIHRKITQK